MPDSAVSMDLIVDSVKNDAANGALRAALPCGEWLLLLSNEQSKPCYITYPITCPLLCPLLGRTMTSTALWCSLAGLPAGVCMPDGEDSMRL